MLLLFFSLSFQLQFINFRPLTQNVLSTNKASNRKMCNNGFNIMTAFVCLQCLGAVTSDFFLIQLVFQFSCNRKRPNFPLLDPLKRPCSKTYIGCRGGSRGRVQRVRTPPPGMTCGFIIQLVCCPPPKKITMWFIGVEVQQETSAPPPKKNPGSAPGLLIEYRTFFRSKRCIT